MSELDQLRQEAEQLKSQIRVFVLKPNLNINDYRKLVKLQMTQLWRLWQQIWNQLDEFKCALDGH